MGCIKKKHLSVQEIFFGKKLSLKYRIIGQRVCYGIYSARLDHLCVRRKSLIQWRYDDRRSPKQGDRRSKHSRYQKHENAKSLIASKSFEPGMGINALRPAP